MDTGPLLAYPLMCSTVNNITINGGTIQVEHFAEVGSKGATLSGTGASIGGGYRTDVNNLVINGGNISNTTSTYLPGTGIGAGEEGDAVIKITGKDTKIDVKAKYVGIGAHAEHITDFDIPIPDDPPSPGDSEDEPVADGDNTGWFGDVKLDITGGDIKVTSEKVCLGGGREDSGKGYIEIDGGNLDLTSNAASAGPVIGPSIYNGRLARITIRGGIINAHRKYRKGNVDEHVACIGNAHHPDLSEHLQNNSIVNMIEFTGGTVRVTDEDSSGNTILGTVGGNQGEDYDRDYTWVSITGGNICAKMLDGDKTKPWSALKEKDGVQVYCQKIDLKVGTQYEDRDKTGVTDSSILLGDGTEYDYGKTDCFLFKESPEFWFWLPKNAS